MKKKSDLDTDVATGYFFASSAFQKYIGLCRDDGLVVLKSIIDFVKMT